MTRCQQGRRRSPPPTTTSTPRRSRERSPTQSDRRRPRSTSSLRRTCRPASRRRLRGSEGDVVSADRGHVVVTGTSTGIGEATALHLAEQGFHVFAGVRRAKDGDELKARAPAPLTPVVVDVTKEQTITAARTLVERAVGDRGL